VSFETFFGFGFFIVRIKFPGLTFEFLGVRLEFLSHGLAFLEISLESVCLACKNSVIAMGP